MSVFPVCSLAAVTITASGEEPSSAHVRCPAVLPEPGLSCSPALAWGRQDSASGSSL